jgi:hypothetical protein
MEAKLTAREEAEPLPRFAIESADFHRGKVVLKGKLPVRDGRRLHELLHLLEAAPDLLAACQRLVAAVRLYEMDVDEGPNGVPYAHHEMMADADAAILKATGGPA